MHRRPGAACTANGEALSNTATATIVRPAAVSVSVEVSAPPVPRLFRGTPYGITFWARLLFELCVCLRPVHRIAAWMSAQG